jgi:hypothetical protein
MLPLFQQQQHNHHHPIITYQQFSSPNNNNNTSTTTTYSIRWSYLKKLVPIKNNKSNNNTSIGSPSRWITHITVFDSRQKSFICAPLDSHGALKQPIKIQFVDISRVQLSRLSSLQFEIDEILYRFDAGLGQPRQKITHSFMCISKNDALLWIDIIHQACPRLNDSYNNKQNNNKPPLPPKPARYLTHNTHTALQLAARTRLSITNVPTNNPTTEPNISLETLHTTAIRENNNSVPPWQDSRASYPKRPIRQTKLPPVPPRPTSVKFSPRVVKTWTFEFEHGDDYMVSNNNNISTTTATATAVVSHKLKFEHDSSDSGITLKNIDEEFELPIDGGFSWKLCFKHDDSILDQPQLSNSNITTTTMATEKKLSVAELSRKFEPLNKNKS